MIISDVPHENTERSGDLPKATQLVHGSLDSNPGSLTSKTALLANIPAQKLCFSEALSSHWRNGLDGT